MSTIDELMNYDGESKKVRYDDTCKYFDCDISPMNHPTALANYLLDQIEHTVTWGCQFVAPMGFGKTTAATVIAHHIHVKRPEFLVVWGEAEDFKDLKGFLARQPKQPLIIIFDDITGALKTMGEKEMQYNFNILTKIRWELDPENGRIPVFTFVTYHYSKNVEKEFRAVLGTTAFCGFGNEEQTNLDSIAPKGTLARFMMEKFARISSKMFSTHEFYLKPKLGAKIRYATDKPLRPFCAVSGNDALITVFAKDDVCNHCAKKKTLQFVPPKQVYQMIKDAYGRAGVQALKMCLWRRGHYLAIGKDAAVASDFIEKRLFPTLSTDFKGLTEEIFLANHKTPPKRVYHKAKVDDPLLKKLREAAITVDENTPLDEINYDAKTEPSLDEEIE